MYRRYKEMLNIAKMTKLKIAIFVGSTREGRLADRVLKFVKNFIGSEHDVVVFDPTKIPFEMLRTPFFFNEKPSEIPAFLHELAKEVETADGYIFLSTEYFASIPPALANMADHFAPWHYLYKPSAIMTYSAGPFGGIRAGSQLRAFCADMGCSSVPSWFAIPEVQDALDENGIPVSQSMKTKLEKKLKITLDQFFWTARALKPYKQKHPPPPFVIA